LKVSRIARGIPFAAQIFPSKSGPEKRTLPAPEEARKREKGVSSVLFSGPDFYEILMIREEEMKSLMTDSSDVIEFEMAEAKSSIPRSENTLSTEVDSGKLKMSPSVLIVGAVAFVGDSSRGVLFPVLWPLCQSLGGSTLDLGILVSMFSLGRFIVTTPFGYFCDKYRHRLTLLISTSILGIGAVCWGNAYATKSLGFLYFAQFTMGVGSGTLGVTRSYVVEQSLPKYRTEVLALMTALQYAGFTVSPFLGSFLSFIGKLNTTTNYWAYSLPAYFIALLCFCCFIALLVTFEDLPSKDETLKEKQTKRNSTLEIEVTNMKDELPKLSVAEKQEKYRVLLLIIIFIFLNITTKGSIAVYETLVSRIAYIDYHISPLVLGCIISTSGAVGTLILLKFKFVTTYLGDDYDVMKFGIGLMILAQFIICSYSGILASVGQFYVAVILIYAIAYPVGQTAVLGAFSKIQKTGKQATLLGWFASAGSFARIVFPIISGLLSQTGRNSPFMFALICLSLSVVYIIVSKRLIYDTILNDSVNPDAPTTAAKKQPSFIYSPLDTNDDSSQVDKEKGESQVDEEKGEIQEKDGEAEMKRVTKVEKGMLVGCVIAIVFAVFVMI
jgi:ceroid-lipofuscinosis MFS transporter 7